MRVMLLASAFNSLTQRVHTELREAGHIVSVEVAHGDNDDRHLIARLFHVIEDVPPQLGKPPVVKAVSAAWIMGTLAVRAKKRRKTFGTVVRLPSGRIARN